MDHITNRVYKPKDKAVSFVDKNGNEIREMEIAQALSKVRSFIDFALDENLVNFEQAKEICNYYNMVTSFVMELCDEARDVISEKETRKGEFLN